MPITRNPDGGHTFPDGETTHPQKTSFSLRSLRAIALYSTAIYIGSLVVAVDALDRRIRSFPSSRRSKSL